MMNLLDFGSVIECPKCGGNTKGAKVEYSKEEVIETSSTSLPFVPVHTYSSEPRPHLEKACPHCGFAWLERTKDS